MENKQLRLWYETIDDTRHENGEDFWYASELGSVLGYRNNEDFDAVLERAKEACKNSGTSVKEHFQTIINDTDTDTKLTRYASYLVALNGDPSKEKIAFAQAYFATKTRHIEVLQKRMAEYERIEAREQLKITEKEFADMLFARGVDGPGIGHVRKSGDEALFGGKTTEDMKEKFGIVKKEKPLADFLSPIIVKAKDLAAAITMRNSRNKNLHGKESMIGEHVSSNRSIREALGKSDIYPEQLSPEEDIKEIEKEHRRETKALQKKQIKELEDATRKDNK